MKTEIKNSLEVNAGGLVGAITFNFSPKFDINFGLSGNSPSKPQGVKSKTEPKIATASKNSSTIHWNGEDFLVVNAGPNKLYEVELQSGRDILISIKDSAGEKFDDSKKKQASLAELPEKYSIDFYLEDKFPLSANPLMDSDDLEGKVVHTVPVYLVVVKSKNYGTERFILWPSCIDSQAKRAGLPSGKKNKQVSNIPELERSQRSLTIDRESDGKVVESRTYYLEWPPQKLGEGSYGAVYAARDIQERRVAIKILYSRQFSTGTGLLSISANDHRTISNGFPSRGASKNPSRQDNPVFHLSPGDLVSLVIDGVQQKSEKSKEKISPAQFDELRKRVTEIIERSSVGNELSQARFFHESQVDQEIRAALSKIGLRAAENYVKVIDSTDLFHTSDASKALAAYHKAMNSGNSLNYSGFAIILELFDYTLKDLLEAQHSLKSQRTSDAPADSSIGDDDPSDDYVLGYDLLRCLSFEERARAALPFLKGVSSSLVEIHLANRMHHDIKPGNIFINERGNDIDVRLGDFSFVGKLDQPGSSEAELRDFIGIGEMHYRSPEQNDFMEIMQAEICHQADDSDASHGQGEAIPEFVLKAIKQDECFFLRIRDPKFRETLVGTNDKFVLSSDQEGSVYPIDFISDQGSHIDVWTRVENKTLREKFLPTRKAQVTFFKIPTRRTDLFGLGGLAYEMLTGGSSPARYYEKLRAVDQAASDLTIDDLLNSFDDFSSSNSVDGKDAAVRNLLSNFLDKHGTAHAPRWIVEFILRSMAFNLEGSYMERFHKNEQKGLFGRKNSDGEYQAVEVSEAAAFLDDLNTELKIDRETEFFLLNPEATSYWGKIQKAVDNFAVNATEVEAKEFSLAGLVRKYVSSR